MFILESTRRIYSRSDWYLAVSFRGRYMRLTNIRAKLMMTAYRPHPPTDLSVCHIRATSLVPSLPRHFVGQEPTTAGTAGANSGFGSCGAGYNNNESLEPSPRQWCSIHGAGGLTHIEGTGLSIGESSTGVLTADEGSCSLESAGGNLLRPTPPPRTAPR